jgi:CRP/FNR family transcriptional regulator, cyclic AMP receptor protein
MAKTDHLDNLGSVSLFSNCSRKDLQRIAKSLDEVTFEPGKVIVEQGRIGQEFFLIEEGEATVRRNGEIIAELGPGDYFGEIALLDRGPRTTSVVADTDMAVLVLGQREFTGLLDSVPGLAYKILTIMARRLREADARAYQA